jgi:hypothetical protein
MMNVMDKSLIKSEMNRRVRQRLSGKDAEFEYGARQMAHLLELRRGQ